MIPRAERGISSQKISCRGAFMRPGVPLKSKSNSDPAGSGPYSSQAAAEPRRPRLNSSEPRLKVRLDLKPRTSLYSHFARSFSHC